MSCKGSAKEISVTLANVDGPDAIPLEGIEKGSCGLKTGTQQNSIRFLTFCIHRCDVRMPPSIINLDGLGGRDKRGKVTMSEYDQ